MQKTDPKWHLGKRCWLVKGFWTNWIRFFQSVCFLMSDTWVTRGMSWTFEIWKQALLFRVFLFKIPTGHSTPICQVELETAQKELEVEQDTLGFFCGKFGGDLMAWRIRIQFPTCLVSFKLWLQRGYSYLVNMKNHRASVVTFVGNSHEPALVGEQNSSGGAATKSAWFSKGQHSLRLRSELVPGQGLDVDESMVKHEDEDDKDSLAIDWESYEITWNDCRL